MTLILLKVVASLLMYYVHASNEREPFHTAGEMESADSSSTIPSSTLDTLSNDCLILCLEFLSNSTDFDHFRWSSRRNCAVYRTFLRMKFQGLNVLFEGTTRQQMIRSWADIEGGIPMIPGFYFPSSSVTEKNKVSGYVTLHRYHRKSKKSVIRGITTNHQLPFLSFLLKWTILNDTIQQETILLSVFEGDYSRQILFYDKFGHSSNILFGLEIFDMLLSGQVIKYKGQRQDRWLQGHLQLLNQTALAVTDLPQSPTQTDAMYEDCDHCDDPSWCNLAIYVVCTFTVVMVIVTITVVVNVL